MDEAANTIDFLFRAKRDKAAARRFFEKTMAQNGSPETVTIDKSGSNLAALHAVNAERETPIKIHQVKYLNNVIERDHRAIKRQTKPMLGLKEFDCARVILSGIEVMHIIKKAQMKCSGKVPRSAAQQFCSLVSYAFLGIFYFLVILVLPRHNRLYSSGWGLVNPAASV